MGYQDDDGHVIMNGFDEMVMLNGKSESGKSLVSASLFSVCDHCNFKYLF